MNTLIARVHRGASWLLIALFLLPAFGVQYFLIVEYLPNFLEFSQGSKNPDQLFSYDGMYLERLYQALGTPGRGYYRAMLQLDYLYMTLAGIGYALLIAKLERRGTFLIALPFLMGIFDLLENSCQLFLLYSYPSLPTAWVGLSSLASSLKMSLSLIAGLYLLLLVARRLLGFFIRQRHSTSSNKKATEN